MMITNLLLCLPLAAADADVSWNAPTLFIEGAAYDVELVIQAPESGAELPAWALTPSAFLMDGKPITARESGETIRLAAHAKLALSFDLGPAITSSKAYSGEAFELALDGDLSDAEALKVEFAKAAPEGLDFMQMSPEELGKYNAVITTNRGTMVARFWPEVAPNHVRNFLDLCYTGFYDGLTFHRVIPGFMIQGGDPTGTGSGNGPRTLEGEFNKDPDYKHVRGVLSMARSQSPNSASSQFFVMHAAAPHLDGSYSAFGKVFEGLEVVDAIVNTPRGRNDKPNEKQYIENAKVIVAP